MIVRWFTDNARIIVTLAVALAIVTGIVLWLTRDDGREAAQAEQTQRSGEAINAAASNAIETIGEREATEDVVDAAVADATVRIEAARDPESVRDAVLATVCKQQSHRNDPACVK